VERLRFVRRYRQMGSCGDIEFMKTIHLVYPHGPRISCPDAIGRNLAIRLGERYKVKLYDWTDWRTIVPATDDVLVGHPHPNPWTCFRRSLKRRGWRRIIMMSPYNHDESQMAFIDPLISLSDRYLAITGNYWFSSIASSRFAHWLPKMIHVDLAVDRNDFPVLKRRFNKTGQRRFIYIGGCLSCKNVGYLSQIANLLKTETEIAWAGPGRTGIPALRRLGFLDFSTVAGKEIVAQYDFLLTVGRADANPATILEAMAWGLIPVCTPQSGYIGYPGIVNVPLDDADGAAAILGKLQSEPEDELDRLQKVNWQLLDSQFTWDRFARQLIDAIESDSSPCLRTETWQRKVELRWAALRSPHSALRPLNAARFARNRFSNIGFTKR